MKLKLKSSALRLGVLGATAALMLATTADVAAATLFEPISYVSHASPRTLQQPALGKLLASPSSAGVQLVKVDAAVMAQGELQFELQGQRVNAVRSKLEQLPNGNSVWYGNLADAGLASSTLGSRAFKAGSTASGVDPLNSLVLVRSGDKLTGTIRHHGKLYRLRPLAQGGHALVEVDETRMPAEHPNTYDLLESIPMAVNAPVSATVGSVDNPTTIRVLVVATDQAVAAYDGDMQALVELAVAESNQGYANSKIALTLELAGYLTTDYRESGDFRTDLGYLRGRQDGYMDEIHAARDSSKADIAILVLDNQRYCGLASAIGSKADTAFASVAWNCATGYYSFAHEIGHLQGARHNIQADPSTQPYAYAHGYQYGSQWRTIMAYACNSKCPRLNYWSSPTVFYGGVPMGDASTADNRRVLINSKDEIAAFR